MKKLYFSICLTLAGYLSQAQINKGATLVGGNLGYNESSTACCAVGSGPSKNSSLSINPSFGRAIKDNLVLGFDVTYGHTSFTQDDFDQPSNSFGAGFFVRKYKSLGNGFYMFGQSRLGGLYSHSSTTSDQTGGSTNNVSNGYSLSLQFYPGIAYAINRKWQIEIGLPNFFAVNYSYNKETTSNTGQPDQVSSNNNFSALSSLTGTNDFTVGIRYFINPHGGR